jgi:PAS domain S-box-containing protein
MGVLANKTAVFKRLRAPLTASGGFYSRLLLSSAIGVVAIAIVAALFVVLAVRDHRLDAARGRTLDTVRAAGKVEKEIASLENGHRAFLLTGQQDSLAAFDQQSAALTSRFGEIDRLVADDAGQSGRVAHAKATVEEWMHKVARPEIEARRQGQPFQLSEATLGRKLLDDARADLDTLQRDEQVALNGLSKDAHSVTLAQEVLVFAPKIERIIAEMEKAESGYLLTGEPALFEAYKRAAAEFTAFHSHLSILLLESPEQAATLGKIRDGVERWQREAGAPEITLKQGGGNVATLVAQGRGRQIMDDVRRNVAAFEQSELDLYRSANTHAQIERILKAAGFGALCVLAIGVLVASSWYSFAAYSRHVSKVETAEAKTRSIIETSIDGILTLDHQGVVQSMNPAAEKMFGYPAATIVGQSVSKLIPQRLFVHDMTQLGCGTMMAVAHRQGFYPFPVEISLSEMDVAGDKQFVALIRDVTERKRSEETLKNIGVGVSATTGEEFVRSLVKQLSKALQSEFAFIVETVVKGNENVGSVMIAEHGHIHRKSNVSLTNTACEEVLKKGFRAHTRTVREKFPYDEMLAELGAESFVAAPLTDHKGQTVGLMGVVDRKPMDNVQLAETTLQIFAARAGAEIERKRFEEDLAAEKERLAVTLRSIGDGFITIDNDGKVVMMNNVAEKLTGMKSDQAIGKALHQVFNIRHERTRKPCQDILQRIVESGTVAGLGGHAILISLDGAECLIETSAGPIRDKINRKSGVVLVFRDVTEKNRMEEERRKAEKLESLGVAAGGIAHDFNNLLTAIIGNVSLAQLSLQPGDGINERLNTAKKASVRAQELAQQLLTFAKGGAPVKKTASIAQLITDTVKFSLRGSNVRADFDLPHDLWPAEVDPAQMSQVIGNLAINAEEAMPAGGLLRVSCENFEFTSAVGELAALHPGRYLKITVRDEGIGIPAEHIKKIFDPYFSTKPKGSGLGLATSYSIVKSHDGLITVESKPGCGSAFFVYLPASSRPARTEKKRTPQPAKGGGRILIMDDEEVICALVTHTLTPLGYAVTETNDAPAAIKTYQQAMKDGQPFDAVIMDLTIPGGMGGQEAIKKLKVIDPNIKAIVSSGYATDPVMSRHRDYGFCAMLAKPYEVTDLGRVVNEVVKGGGDGDVENDASESAVGDEEFALSETV